MIEFVTLLLGLVTGNQAVELSVSEQVALVELRIDGRFVGGATRPPWIIDCDFGDGLSPHELTATAYDSERSELETIRQWVNLPRERLEARLALDRQGGRATARLIWTALDHRGPPTVHVTFDGQPLVVEDLEAIVLPEHDLRGLHFLRAELRFPESERARGEQTHAELVFGGTYGDEVATELTGLVLSSSSKRLPDPAQMAGWFQKRGKPLEVVAVERSPINLLIVRERSSTTRDVLYAIRDHYLKLLERDEATTALRRPRRRRPVLDPVLGGRDRVRFAFPTAGRERTVAGQGAAPMAFEQIPVSRDARDFGSLFFIVTDAFYPDEEEPVPEQALADAVAIAGVVAAAGDQRRAVILIRSGETKDDSRFTPREVRKYLQRLAVPLVVWSIPAQGADASSPWGEERDVSELWPLTEALADLRKQLRTQVVVWLDGAHLTHEIELTDKVRGFRKAG